MRFLSVVFAIVFVSQTGVRADDAAVAKAQNELLPRPFQLKADAIPLSDALAQLAKQTGNQVADRRQKKSNPNLKLNLENSTFWPALDAIAQSAGCGISTYQTDGQVALVDNAALPAIPVYQGIFRIFAGNIQVAKDFETGAHLCTLTFDIAWEPRVEPLYLEVGPFHVTYAADRQGVRQKAKAASQGKISVAGRNAIGVNISLPAPDRSVGKIESLEGQLRLTSSGKMLTYSFPQMKADRKKDEADGVQVALSPVKTTSRRWSVLLEVNNPAGTPVFESYQSWLGNNRIFLEKGEGPGRTVWLPDAADERVEMESATQAKVFYSFNLSSKNDKGQPADWNLVYRTPGRIVEMTVPFKKKDLPLP